MIILLILSWVNVRWHENGRSHRKNTWPPASRTWLVSICVVFTDLVGTYRYWAPKYDSCLTDRNSRYIWIPIFRFWQKLKLVFQSLQTLALSKFTTGSGNRPLLIFRNRSVYRLSSVNKNQHIFRHLIGYSDCTNQKHERLLERP